ncbi:MAG TPA: DUF5683 domain-containing protein [Bacteroidota bacterium]|nr:DUF5683 domain-containing protein [Bacteroidota bacterium]
MNHALRISVLFLFSVTLGTGYIRAQGDSLRILHDTTRVQAISLDSASRSDSSREAASTYHPKKSPWLAVGLSAGIPGLGQIYDGGYWKVPVIWGIGGYWISQWIQLNDKYKQYRDAYAQSVAGGSGGNPTALTLRDFYRDERDKFAWFLGGLYFLNLLDAYVGAHLYDFDVSPDLSLDGRFTPKVTATIRFRF